MGKDKLEELKIENEELKKEKAVLLKKLEKLKEKIDLAIEENLNRS